MFGGRRWWGSYQEFKLREQIALARKGKLSQSQKRHLTLLGVSLPAARERKIDKWRPLQSLSAWWETTAIEHQLEDLADFARKLAIIDLINIVAGLTIIVSLGSWFWGWQERRENELFATREVIENLKGDQSGVVRVALERLLRNGFSLAGLPLSETNLTFVNLKGASMEKAKLEGAILQWANLSEANLNRANLNETGLSWANLSEANLSLAYLRKADLFVTNLRGANLKGAYLREAYLGESDLRGTDLRGTDLRGASLWRANLTGTDLRGADLEGTNLADIQYNRHTIWPEGFDPPPSRDGYDRNP